MSHDITPAARPIYDDKIDDKTDEKDVTVAPAELGFSDGHEFSAAEESHIRRDLDVSKEEMLSMEGKIAELSLERTSQIIAHVMALHKYDQNFPGAALARMSDFLGNPDVMARPEKHQELIDEMKMEAILSTENSPYSEVRAVVDPTDDPDMPSLTIRVWVIGCVFSAAGSFIDSFFLMRNPPVYIGANVAQLLSYPCGKFMARVLPDKRFKLFGREHSLNPGTFNKKEHMLITIMAAVSFGASYTTYIVPTQALPFWFNEAYARNFGYQIMTSLSINFVGYGLAGLTRRFLVYPAAAVWPSSLSTIALNKAFHTDENEAVKGPFGRIYNMSRQKFFLCAFGAMFIYFFFPGFIFQALSYFSWMTWIAPNNITLSAITSPLGGLGLNPIPTFDWNVFSIWLVPLTIPTFSIMNQFAGLLIAVPMCAAIWFSNSWFTAYMPINSNHTFSNTGKAFNVTKILTDGKLDEAKYQEYSQPWMSAGYITSFFWYFALYGATVSYVILYHRQQIASASVMVWKSVLSTLRIRRHEEEDEEDLADDVHARIMRKNYKDVPEWMYFIVLVIAATVGMVGIGIYPTQTSPVVVIFGIIMPLIALIPVGLVQSVTGIQVALNVLAEFIGLWFHKMNWARTFVADSSGGSWVEGNANALIWFKTFGYISTYQALAFSNDLKLAHYTHIKPYHTFVCQMVATLIFTFVSAGILNFQMSFKDVCTPTAQFGFTCPGHNTFFTSAVFWGTLSPKRLFGPGRRYNMMLLGFPIGVAIPLAHWLLRRKWPRMEMLRQIHPVMICAGPALWGSPYNIGNFFPNVPVVWFSWQYLRRKYPGFWAKYNFVVAAAFPAGIAIAAVVIFFALQLPAGGLSIDWWGNNVVGEGCDKGCPLLEVPEIGYFGDAPGSGKFI